MPKLKTHSGTKDRVQVTKNGKVKFRKSGGAHFQAGKSKSRKRTMAGVQDMSGKIMKTIKKKLGV
jgi:large subunit ribosomal protein L35